MGFVDFVNKHTDFIRKCCGWTKQIYYIYTWFCIIRYILVDEEIKNDYLFSFLTNLCMMIVLYAWTLLWLCIFSKTMTLLKNINEDNEINIVMNQLFQKKPKIEIVCSCYHYKMTITNYSNGRGGGYTTVTPEIVETYNETRDLDIFSYLDISGMFRLKQTNKNFIQLEMDKEINLNDEISYYDVQNIKNELFLKNRYRDGCISITVNKTIPNMKKFYLIKLNKDKKYLFVNKYLYILSVILTLDQFYRLYIDCIS